MWVLFTRGPPPDAPYWPGRRWLAAIDAVAWPGAAWYGLSHVVGSGGIAVALPMALLVVSAVRRLHSALFVNHQYHFTTWRWGRVVVWMWAVAILMKLALGV